MLSKNVFSKRVIKKRVEKRSKPKSTHHVKPSPANRKVGAKHRHAGQTWVVKQSNRANKPVKYWSKVVLRGGAPILIERNVAGQTMIEYDGHMWCVHYNKLWTPTKATLGDIEHVVGELPPGTGKMMFLYGTNGNKWSGFFDTEYNPNNEPGVHEWNGSSGLPSKGYFMSKIVEAFDAQ